MTTQRVILRICGKSTPLRCLFVAGSLAKACKAFASCWGPWHGAANRRFLVWPLAAYEGFSTSPE